ncbi:MAG: hypothetical protein ACQCN4_06720 [Candidatus Bathyarchaeia archaeon]|jgi:hypothetical protein
MIMDPDCNCGIGGSNNGGKGTTVWFSDDVTLAVSGGNSSFHTWSFTDTMPRMYDSAQGGGTHVCLVNYEIVTASNTAAPVTIGRYVNGSLNYFGSIVHSSVAGHNIVESFDLINTGVYNHGGQNSVTFVNYSPIPVEIRNFNIIRAYAIWGLRDETGYIDPPDVTPNGTIDYTRQDYPCNFDSIGERMSCTHWNEGAESPISIAPGQYKRWIFTQPSSSIGNYIGPYKCMFNFNNVTRDNDSNPDLHYSVKLNGHVIADYYHAGSSQFPTVDLTSSVFYDDRPNATNTVDLCNNGTVNINLIDQGVGGIGCIDIYRFYKVKNIIQDDFNDNSTNGSIWDTLQAGNASVNETGNQLRVEITSGGSWSQAGYKTKYMYDTQQLYGSTGQGFEASIDVTALNGLMEMDLLVSCDSGTTNTDPCGLNNWYRIMKNNNGSYVTVQSRIGGGSVTTKFNATWASSVGQLKIRICNGIIAFYENNQLRYTESYALPSNQCYIYAYTSSNQIGNGTFDNFKLLPIPIISRRQFASNQVSYSSTYSVTLPSQPTSGNKLIAVVGNCSPSGVATSYISQSGVTWTQAYMAASDNGVAESEIWIGTMGTNASQTLTLYATGSSYYHVCHVAEYEGLASSPLDKVASANSHSNTVNSGTTSPTSQANELWIGALCGTSGSYGLSSTPTNSFKMIGGELYNSIEVGFCEKFANQVGSANVSTTTFGWPAWAGCIATFKGAT